MARQVLYVLALCFTGALAVPAVYENVDVKVLQERQMDLMELYYHIHEPLDVPKCLSIASSWSLEKNLDQYRNITAVKTYISMLEHKWYLPRAVPFAIYEHTHIFEAMTLFNVFYSAKDYQTFYKTAVYLRDIINEGLFVYVLNLAIMYRPDTQGIAIPPIYEVFPSFFNNGEIMTTAQRINTHGHHHIKNFPSTYLWDENVVIKQNFTTWPYLVNDATMSYFTNDFSLNAYYYYFNMLYPYWLGSEMAPGLKLDKRGELWWFIHRQIVARYYLERLSNCQGEIPEISHVVKEGYMPGLLYHNGIPFPSRPNNYHLDEPELVEEIGEVLEYERRIWEAIEKGFIVDEKGEKINILSEHGFDILASVVQANADSPNAKYYKNFLKIWKQILGNSHQHPHEYHNKVVPLVLPSVLENYQTALRDPAFYMIWKRILNIFMKWQKRMPMYKPEELADPAITIQKVDIDKLVTYFEYSYMNLTSHLHRSDTERKGLYDDVSVLAQHPRLNHKPFSVKIHVKSDVAKKVLVTFFLAPKYDSKGFEIPLHHNTDNFYMLDHFVYDMTAGECTITRESTANAFTVKDWTSARDVFQKCQKGQWAPEMNQFIDRFPHHMLLPKGKAGGMPFQLAVYIQEYKEPKVAYGTGYDPKMSLGLGTGARYIVDQNFAFPMDRPMFEWQIKDVRNLWFQDILIHHKHTPEIDVPHME